MPRDRINPFSSRAENDLIVLGFFSLLLKQWRNTLKRVSSILRTDRFKPISWTGSLNWFSSRFSNQFKCNSLVLQPIDPQITCARPRFKIEASTINQKQFLIEWSKFWSTQSRVKSSCAQSNHETLIQKRFLIANRCLDWVEILCDAWPYWFEPKW